MNGQLKYYLDTIQSTTIAMYKLSSSEDYKTDSYKQQQYKKSYRKRESARYKVNQMLDMAVNGVYKPN